MPTQVLINVEATDMRVAMLEDMTLVELFVEHFDSKSILGNIYKGRVEGIIPGLKAVFVNIGLERNAFLHFSDVLKEYELPTHGKPERLSPHDAHRADKRKAEEEEAAEDDDYIEPQHLPGDHSWLEEAQEVESSDAKREQRKRPLRVGDSILVQVVKEPISEKGPRVTSYVSIPGRYLVMMPFSENQGGVSRKIENPEERRRLRDILRDLDRPSGSFIMRTAGLSGDETAIREDHQALIAHWKAVKRKFLKNNAPALVHNEQEILHRLVRDTLRNDVQEILIDSKAEMKKLIKACEEMAPRMIKRIHYYESPRNMFDVFEVEKQFQKALRRKVWLKSGGFVVIDETEALTAIDVNSGKYVGKEDQDEVILKTNLEACKTISRQLRLRDLGGLIIIDFIDMTNRDHQQQVLRELKSCLKKDNAKYAMTGFSEFGLVEMTRKRVRMSLAHAIYQPCPYCEGTGKIQGEAQIWKIIKYALLDELRKNGGIESIELAVHSQMRTYIEKTVLNDLSSIADRYQIEIRIVGKPDYHHQQFSVVKQMKSTDEESKAGSARKKRPPREKRLESAGAPQDNPA